ncbi:CHAT domain-containing protein [Nonomuraea bangladeshensis]|uniref:CHAT domain-containing protein n=1 Tax=Nonomuraea bangladeshensis TaxID=404385 RepID=UPI0031D33B5C
MSERDRLLAAILRRLEAASDGGDPSEVTSREALAEARRLEDLVDGGDLEALRLLGWLHLYRVQAGAPDADRSLETAVDMFTVCFVSGVQGLPEPLLPVLALRAMPPGLALLQQAMATTDLGLISACVELWRNIVAALSEEDDQRAGSLSNLSGALRARFDRTGQAADLDAAIDAGRAAAATAPTTPEGRPQRAQILSNLAGSLRARFELTGDVADLEAAVETGQAAVGSVPARAPERSSYQNNLALALKARFHHTRAREDLDAALTTFQEVAAATPPDHPHLGTRLSNVGISLQERFELDGTPQDLDAAIDAGRAAVAATPAGHPRYAVHLGNLATALHMRYELAASPEDLRELVEVCERAVAAVPEDHPSYAAHLAALAEAWRTRFLITNTDDDLEAAVGAARALLGRTPRDDPERRRRTLGFLMVLLPWAQRGGHVDDLDDLADLDVLAELVRDADVGEDTRASMLSFLTSLLQRRYERTGTTADADALVAAARDAVAASGAGDHDHPMRLSQLSVALRSRFERTGDAADLEAAVEAGEASVAAAGPGHATYGSCVSHLSLALQARFDLTGDRADLARAVDGFRAAVESGDGDPDDTARWQANLAQALTVCFEQTGAAEDLDMAIDAGRAAAGSLPAGPARAKALSNLGVMLRVRFGQTGVLADLDEAARLGREAVSCTPADHPDRPGYLASLGAALRLRYERIGSAGDLDAAVEVCGEAARLVPEDHPDRAKYMSTFGIALRARYERNRVASDLDLAVEAGRAAASSPGGGPLSRAKYLANLVGMLMSRFEDTGAEADLDEAEAASAEAVRVLPPGHPDHAPQLNNRGAVLRARFLHRGVPADLDAAIDALESAVRLAPAGQPGTVAYLVNLGLARSLRFERAHDRADLDAARSAYERAARTASAAPSRRVLAARSAAGLIAAEDPGRAADLLEEAVLLLPELTPRRLRRGDQQDALAAVAGLAADAAALALAAPGDPVARRAERALRLLEAGRAVLLSQILDTRSDLTDLYRRDRELAERFVTLRDRLDGSGEAPGPSVITGDAPEGGPATGDDDQAEERLRTAAELAGLIERIRVLPGLEFFGLPPSLDELRAEAVDGPIVTCNVGTFRSDALVLTAQGVIAVELPGLDQTSVVERVVAFHEALERTSEAPTLADRIAAQRTLLEILRWLWDEVAGPVLHALGIDGPPEEGADWPRLWWAPGGLLSLLPLHAAGHHAGPGDPGRTVLDRVVSSYTPTIRALHHARHRDATPSAEPPGRTLVVAVPAAPGVPGRLAHVPAEAATVAALLPGPIVLTVQEEDGPSGDGEPTKAEVLRLLPGCAIAHFACHGHNDPADPSASRLLLLDHADDPLTVAALVPVRLEQVQLAYLSACSTAFTGRADLLDEAIHLAGAFQLAGFPQVVGTLWEIDDQLAVLVADGFYRDLCAGTGLPDTSRSAHALHRAVRDMRGRFLHAPSLWAAHLHVGA